VHPRATGALEALDQYSHVWLVFVFHENTNGAATVKAKVTPPKLGSRVGVFSTRSPHRPNAIGLTLARLDRVAGDTLHLAGADLVDGVCQHRAHCLTDDFFALRWRDSALLCPNASWQTPILDVKPYIALYDSLPEGGSTQPAWIAKPSVAPFEDVRFTEACRRHGARPMFSSVHAKSSPMPNRLANPVCACAQEAARDIALLIPRSRLYAGESVDYVLGFVAGVLREDIRSGHARQSKDEAEVYNVWLDVMRIHWRIDRGTTVTVLGAEHAP
jgi:tRNA (Thr-GGU) A37 N-methylase